MSRPESFNRMLTAAAKIQLNIALILEAKAIEADKSRGWICNSLDISAYGDHAQQVKETMAVHDQLIGLIDGLSKLESALAKNLKIILNEKEEEEAMGGGGMGDLFNTGGGFN
ncbi:restriction endonuclease subunit S [Paenibacillus agricola]|uniref:Restriction endonuclease subunit S n=1 Tax=Paenibacillus agricola TaxID=2716264 RepID=A0ABX0J857_9BACL|nr:restriction endonuclease subunit S [Paenibacillus agricola]NHN30191.1 restriction endonuclease subunit S [Paenibacillus agricola]